MKVLFKAVVLVFLVAGIAACNNSDIGVLGENGDGTAGTAPNAFIMKAVIDSVEWTATSIDTKVEQSTIYITGKAADGSQVVLELSERPGIGIFPMRRGNGQAGTYVIKTGIKYYAPFAGTSGVINITEYVKDSILKGEFSFSASNTMDLHLIEKGVFSAPLHQNASKPAL
jgi:hypothetical protein